VRSAQNSDALKDVRDEDIDHLTKAETFLVNFLRVMSARGSHEPEAIVLADSWGLSAQHPELRQMIEEQLAALRR
jgi:hypothetical protein